MRHKIAKGHFTKIAETAHQASSTEAAYSEYSIAIHLMSIAGCKPARRTSFLSAGNSQPGRRAVSAIFFFYIKDII